MYVYVFMYALYNVPRFSDDQNQILFWLPLKYITNLVCILSSNISLTLWLIAVTAVDSNVKVIFS